MQEQASRLTWENVGLISKLVEALSSFSTEAGSPDGLDIMLEENISSRLLPTNGRVLWDLSQPPVEVLVGGAGLGAMEMEAGVALTVEEGGTGGWGAGGLGALCLVDLAGAGGGCSAGSASLEFS